MDNMEISPIRAKALAVFAAALNAVLNNVPFTLPSGTVPKSPLVKKDAFGKKDKGGKKV